MQGDTQRRSRACQQQVESVVRGAEGSNARLKIRFSEPAVEPSDRSGALLSKSIVWRLSFEVGGRKMQPLASQCAETLFDVPRGKRRYFTGALAMCRWGHGVRSCRCRLADGLRSRAQ